MSKILIFEDTNAIENGIKNLNEVLPYIQNFAIHLNEMSHDSKGYFDEADLNTLIRPQDYALVKLNRVLTKKESIDLAVRDIISDKLTPDGFPRKVNINKSLTKETIQYPDYSELIVLATKINSLFHSHRIRTDHFMFSKGGHVTLKKDVLREISELHRMYADTPEEISRHMAARMVAEGMLVLADMDCLGSDGLNCLQLKDMIWGSIDSTGKNIVNVNPCWIKSGRTSLKNI